MPKLKRFLTTYALVFSVIWVGYGLYAVITGQPSGTTVLVFGIAFAAFVSLASWFSYWLMGHYKKVDRVAKEILRNPRKSSGSVK